MDLISMLEGYIASIITLILNSSIMDFVVACKGMIPHFHPITTLHTPIPFIPSQVQELILNFYAFGFLPWTSDIPIFQFYNPITNCWLIFVYMFLLPREILPRAIRLTWSEKRRLGRRNLTNKLLAMPIECRGAAIELRWTEMQPKISNAHASSNRWSLILDVHRRKVYRILHRCEISALEQLHSAKDQHATLMLLAFVDASRHSSAKTLELHDHLVNVLAAWDAEAQSPKTDRDCKSPTAFKFQGECYQYESELELLHRGHEGRKAAEDHRARRMASDLIFRALSRNPFVFPREWDYLEGENLDFVECGPSVERLRAIAKWDDGRTWGVGRPELENQVLATIAYTGIFRFGMYIVSGILATRGIYGLAVVSACTSV